MVNQAPCLTLGIVVWSLLSFPAPSFGLLSPLHRRRPGRHPKLQLQVTSTDGPRGLRRRWRRRKKDSVVAPVDKDGAEGEAKKATGSEAKEASTSDYVNNGAEDVHNGMHNEEAKSQCPIFSMTFPRYRINTTGGASKRESEQRRARRVQRGVITKLVKSNSNEKEERRSPWGSVGGLIQGVLGGASNALPGAAGKNARKLVESLYRDEVQQGMFRWASSADVKDLPFLDEDLFSAASFWRNAANVVSQPTMGQQQFYLALPETTKTVAQNLCDVLNWYAEQQNIAGDENRGGEEFILRAELDSRSEVPVVRFTPTASKGMMQQNRERRENSLPTAEDTERRTKEWVKRLLVQLGICPFTKSEIKSGQGLGDLGVPVANIMYRHSSAVVGNGGGVYELMADTWEAISDMVGCGPSGKNGVSSILLSAPGYDDDFNCWAGPIFAMLETCVSAIQGEEMIGVVCFHPRYVTPDGSSWPGFGHMHSKPRLKKWYTEHSATSPAEQLSDNEIAAGGAWQRRTPHAVINVLRAEQLEAAEGRRSTGELYERNIRVLMGKEDGIGYESLAAALEKERNL